MKTVAITHTGVGGVVRVPRDADAKAEYAARVLARRQFGRRGVVATLRLDSHATDGSAHTYEAFIGRRNLDGSVSGRNVWIYT